MRCHANVSRQSGKTERRGERTGVSRRCHVMSHDMTRAWCRASESGAGVKNGGRFAERCGKLTQVVIQSPPCGTRILGPVIRACKTKRGIRGPMSGFRPIVVASCLEPCFASGRLCHVRGLLP